jgi:hypothetical protein
MTNKLSFLKFIMVICCNEIKIGCHGLAMVVWGGDGGSRRWWWVVWKAGSFSFGFINFGL